jgi:hypothetical protein
VEEGPNLSDSGTFSDLEQSFFEAAPPDVPVPPPEPMRFDDLVPSPPARPRKSRERREPNRPAAPGARFRNARARGAVATASLSRLVATGGRRFVLTPALRTGRGTARLAAAGWLRLLPRLRAAREATRRGIGAAVARLAADLPTERPDRKTIVAAIAVLTLVMSLSAGVVTSRGGAWATLRTPTPGTSAGAGGGAVADGAGITPPAQCPVAITVAPPEVAAPPTKTASRTRSHHVSKSISHQRKVAAAPAARAVQPKVAPAPAHGAARVTAIARKPTFAR